MFHHFLFGWGNNYLVRGDSKSAHTSTIPSVVETSGHWCNCWTLCLADSDTRDSCTALEFPAITEPEISVLLHTYKEVFSIPYGLPPNRSHDHCIPLFPNIAPVKMRPYRYPHSQKSEIEKIVADMLQEGIIQPRSSPFSSPVLLLKKKDGT